MPNFLDIAAEKSVEEYVDEMDGQSLLAAMNGKPASLSDAAISEFAADGSTGPCRMVKKRRLEIHVSGRCRHCAIEPR